MQRSPVSSSNIASIGFESNTLEIEFHNGGIYQYFDVPQNVYQELMRASSHGSYLSSNIKGHFRYSKI